MPEINSDHLHENKGYIRGDIERVTRENNIFKEKDKDFYELCVEILISTTVVFHVICIQPYSI
jgi:hypothetical protein